VSPHVCRLHQVNWISLQAPPFIARGRILGSVMRVLISGAGTAGPTLAYWLARYGPTPTIIKTAPRLPPEAMLSSSGVQNVARFPKSFVLPRWPNFILSAPIIYLGDRGMGGLTFSGGAKNARPVEPRREPRRDRRNVHSWRGTVMINRFPVCPCRFFSSPRQRN
jgi:hypothetical protein